MSANDAGELRYSPLMYLKEALDSSAPFGLLLHLLNHHIRVEVVLVNQKVIWALCLHVPGSKRRFGEILEIESNDGLGAPVRTAAANTWR